MGGWVDGFCHSLSSSLLSPTSFFRDESRFRALSFTGRSSLFHPPTHPPTVPYLVQVPHLLLQGREQVQSNQFRGGLRLFCRDLCAHLARHELSTGVRREVARLLLLDGWVGGESGWVGGWVGWVEGDVQR